MRTGGRNIRTVAIALVFLLVTSATIGAFFVWRELRNGGMDTKWVYSAKDIYGNKNRYTLLYVDSTGSIIADENSGPDEFLIALEPDGALKWRVGVNSDLWPVQGADGGFYYVDWSYGSVWPSESRNLTALDVNGNFKWDFEVANGSLDIWGIYPDGEVIVHHYNYSYDQSAQEWIIYADEIIAISGYGTELWSMDAPFPAISWQKPRVSDNGTFLVDAWNENRTYEIGITKDGSQIYIEELESYITPYWESSWGTNGTTVYELRKEFIDDQTSVICVYAISVQDGSQQWRTVLRYSDNPHHESQGSAVIVGTIVDAEGTIYCGDIDGKYSYALNPSGEILWQKPYFGRMVISYPTGGVLVIDENSIKKIDPDGSVAWRHFVRLSGNGLILLGHDDSVYYSQDTSIVALAHVTGLSNNTLSLLVVIVVDASIIAPYGLVHWLRRRKLREA